MVYKREGQTEGNEKAVPDRSTGWMWAEKKRKLRRTEIFSVAEYDYINMMASSAELKKSWRKNWF